VPKIVDGMMSAASPQHDEAPADELGLMARMGEDVTDGIFALLRHVGDLAHLRVLRSLASIVNRVLLAQPNYMGVGIVAYPQLQAERGSQRNDAMEDHVIADRPWNAA